MTNETKQIDGYWVIGTNKWSADIYTKQEAEKYATTLINCENCINCSDFRDCSSCSSCRSCSSCSSCSEFKRNPERITSGILGSRNSQTTFYWNDEKEQIVCGCFKGTLLEFETKIKETHGDNDFAKGYFNWIEAVKQYRLTYGGKQ
jgi:hypothetical protein